MKKSKQTIAKIRFELVENSNGTHEITLEQSGDYESFEKLSSLIANDKGSMPYIATMKAIIQTIESKSKIL